MTNDFSVDAAEDGTLIISGELSGSHDARELEGVAKLLAHTQHVVAFDAADLRSWDRNAVEAFVRIEEAFAAEGKHLILYEPPGPFVNELRRTAPGVNGGSDIRRRR